MSLQEAINTIKPRSIKKLAGNVGPIDPETFANQLAKEGRALSLCLAYMDRRTDWYRRLARAKPKTATFLNGWLNRTNACSRVFVRNGKAIRSGIKMDWKDVGKAVSKAAPILGGL